MNLFIASGIVHPESGGPATYLHRLLPELIGRGWTVRVVSYSDDTPTQPYPYPIVRVPRVSFPKRYFDYARAALPLLAWADVVYLHTLGLPLLPTPGRRAPRIAKIVGDQGWERAQRKGWIPPTLGVDAYQTADLPHIAAADRAARAREARALQGVVVPSEYLKRMVIGWGVTPERVQVITNAPPPRPPVPPLSQAEARARLALPDDGRPILLYVGRLTPWKGVDATIEALRRFPHARLMVAGDGEGLAALRESAVDLGDRVVFLGRVARETVAVWMRAADYLVLYSGYEGLSHTLLEALEVGTPAIASDQGGNPEVITDRRNGLLVPYTADPREGAVRLAEAFRVAFAPGMRDLLASQAHPDEQRFDFQTMVKQTDTLLRGWVLSH